MKLKLYLIFSFLLFVNLQFLIAQQDCKCELSAKLVPEIVKKFNAGNIDSAEFYIKQFSNSTSPICKTDYFDGLAQISLSRKKIVEARNYLSQEYGIVEKINCSNKPLIRYYNTLSKYYSETSNLDSTIIVALKIIELASQQKEQYGLARAFINAGSIFNDVKDFSKSTYYYQQALTVAIKQNDTTIQCAAMVRLAGNFSSLYDKERKNYYLDSIFYYSQKAISISRYPQDFIEVLSAYTSISKYYKENKQLYKSISFADSIIIKSPKGYHDFDRHLLNAYQSKAEAFIELNDFRKASIMADSAVHYATLFNKQFSISPLQLVYTCSKILGNTQKALWAHEQMTNIKDSVFTLEKNKTIQELEKKYNQTKNENTITKLSQQKKIYLLFVIVAVSLIIIIIFYLRQQKLKHQQIVMETEQRLNRARMNPHFFFNTLASLQSFALTENDNKNLAANISKFSHIMRETLESTYKEYVTIEQEIDFLNEYLELQKLRFPNRFSYSIQAEKMLEIDELQIPSMIIQPFIENAIEHGLKGITYPGIIDVHFKKYKEELMIEIIDNGNGLSTVAKENGEHISRASQIIKDRIYLLNIKLKTKAGFMLDNNIDGKGVAVKIRLPLLYK